MLENFKKISAERAVLEKGGKDVVFSVLEKVLELMQWRSIRIFSRYEDGCAESDYYFRDGKILSGHGVACLPTIDWERDVTRKYFKSWMLPLIQKRLENLAAEQQKKLDAEKEAFAFFQKMLEVEK